MHYEINKHHLKVDKECKSEFTMDDVITKGKQLDSVGKDAYHVSRIVSRFTYVFVYNVLISW
jgi:hypothetical protein